MPGFSGNDVDNCTWLDGVESRVLWNLYPGTMERTVQPKSWSSEEALVDGSRGSDVDVSCQVWSGKAIQVPPEGRDDPNELCNAVARPRDSGYRRSIRQTTSPLKEGYLPTYQGPRTEYAFSSSSKSIGGDSGSSRWLFEWYEASGMPEPDNRATTKPNQVSHQLTTTTPYRLT